MRYTPNRKFSQERRSDTNPVMYSIGSSAENGRYVQATQASASRSATKNTSSPLQALRVRLGGGLPLQEQGISLDTLLSDLFSSHWERRVTAIRALELLGNQTPARVVRALAGALTDETPCVRVAAAQALIKLEKDAPNEDDIVQLLDDPSWEVRAGIVQLLGKSGASVPIQKLENMLTDEEPAVRMVVVSALGKLKRPELLGKLITALEDEDLLVRLATVEALGEQEENIPTRALMKKINDEDEDVRCAVLEALSNLGERVPIGILAVALEDEEEVVRLTALRLLKKLGERMPLESLFLTLKDQSEQVQTEASKLLARLDTTILNRVSPTFLVQLLQDESEHLRAIAAWMLGEQKAFTAKEPLLATLNDSSEIVRTAVIWTLRELEVYGEEEPVVKLYPHEKGFRSQKDIKVWYATPPAPLSNFNFPC